MKINEKLYLEKAIKQINKFGNDHVGINDFYDNLDELNIKSLQDLSFNSDLKFFEHINFIISVIISIISSPLISHKGENIIVRSDQVSSLQTQSFIKTMKDSKLWKHNKENKMIPEHVHYYQNVDEIAIYENKFIVMLIDMIESEMDKYSSYYSNMILTYKGSNSLSISTDNVQKAFSEIGLINKKIKRIKVTYFYKEIARKGKIKIKHVVPSNILLKNRLYNFCFKFYRHLITYQDNDLLIKDMTKYYYVLLLKELKNQNFHASKTNVDLDSINFRGLKIDNHFRLYNSKFTVIVGNDELTNGISLIVINKKDKTLYSNTLLMFDHSSSFETVKDNLKEINLIYKDYDQIEAMSLISRAYIDNEVKVIKQDFMKEDEMLRQYLNDKFLEIKCSKDLYTSFCPVCKSRSIDKDEFSEICNCQNCKSSYKFVDESANLDQTLWFIKLRRC